MGGLGTLDDDSTVSDYDSGEAVMLIVLFLK